MGTLPAMQQRLSISVFRAACAFTVAYGAALVCLPGAMEGAYEAVLDLPPGGFAAFPEAARRYIRLVHAVLGAVLAGWGAMMFLWMGGDAGRRVDPWTAGIPLLLWFIPDTAASLVHGFPANAAMNVVFLAALGGPLLALAAQGKPAAA
jgi:hypothetical protein